MELIIGKDYYFDCKKKAHGVFLGISKEYYFDEALFGKKWENTYCFSTENKGEYETLDVIINGEVVNCIPFFEKDFTPVE